jgi:hypothetical protein
VSDLLEELIAARLAEVRRRAAARAPRTPGLVARIVKRPRALAPEEKAERARTEMARLKARLNRSTS